MIRYKIRVARGHLDRPTAEHRLKEWDVAGGLEKTANEGTMAILAREKHLEATRWIEAYNTGSSVNCAPYTPMLRWTGGMESRVRIPSYVFVAGF